MIYTVTLNPALDHFLEVDALRVDDANRVRSECLYASGKGIDVSRAIRRLGGDSMALGFIGGHNGRVMVEMLKAEGVTTYSRSWRWRSSSSARTMPSHRPGAGSLFFSPLSTTWGRFECACW